MQRYVDSQIVMKNYGGGGGGGGEEELATSGISKVRFFNRTRACKQTIATATPRTRACIQP